MVATGSGERGNKRNLPRFRAYGKGFNLIPATDRREQQFPRICEMALAGERVVMRLRAICSLPSDERAPKAYLDQQRRAILRDFVLCISTLEILQSTRKRNIEHPSKG